MFEKKVMEMIYRKAGSPEELVWHSEEPARFLVDAVQRRRKPGKALDIGCGAGVYSIYLAKHGYEVTGLDFIPKALEMAAKRARAEHASVRWVCADLLTWGAPSQFDLVLDSGCLHSIKSRKLPDYRKQLLSWLAPQGDFILVHWGKRHLFDWRPIGPRRRERAKLLALFSPPLEEEAYEHQLVSGIPFPIGPTILAHCSWFRKTA
jgi:SAM-dependent methyltransferase